MGSFEGARLCTIEEYQYGLDEKADPNEIVIGQHFSFIGALSNPAFPKFGAYITPVRAASMPNYYGNGLIVAYFNQLSADMGPSRELYRLVFNSNGMVATENVIFSKGSELDEGYIKGYEDGVGGGLVSLLAELDLTASVS